MAILCVFAEVRETLRREALANETGLFRTYLEQECKDQRVGHVNYTLTGIYCNFESEHSERFNYSTKLEH